MKQLHFVLVLFGIGMTTLVVGCAHNTSSNSVKAEISKAQAPVAIVELKINRYDFDAVDFISPRVERPEETAKTYTPKSQSKNSHIKKTSTEVFPLARSRLMRG